MDATMNDTWLDKIKHAYWHTLPYNWRPGQIWYRLKCWVGKRYTTVKPRYLRHTWCDRTELMPHMMFELLCQFIEQECSPGHIEWYGEWGHKIAVNGKEKYVMDEMKDLIAWWHEVRNKEYEEVSDILWAEAEGHSPTPYFEPFGDSDELFEWKQRFASDGDKELWKRCMGALTNIERIMNEALEERLHRLIKLIPYMWT